MYKAAGATGTDSAHIHIALSGEIPRKQRLRPDQDLILLVSIGKKTTHYEANDEAFACHDFWKQVTSMVKRGGVRSRNAPFIGSGLLTKFKEHLVPARFCNTSRSDKVWQGRNNSGGASRKKVEKGRDNTNKSSLANYAC